MRACSNLFFFTKAFGMISLKRKIRMKIDPIIKIIVFALYSSVNNRLSASWIVVIKTATKKKFFIMKIVAFNFCGLSRSLIRMLFLLSLSFFNSLIFAGTIAKKASSAPETRARMTSNIKLTIDNIIAFWPNAS